MKVTHSRRRRIRTGATALLLLTMTSLVVTSCAPWRVRNNRDDAYPGNDRVCCERGRENWFTLRRDCRLDGGYPVRFKFCRR